MREYLERLGYPGTSSRRPLLWTLFVALMLVANAWNPDSRFGGRVMTGLALVFLGKYAADSWRRHHRAPVPPLGRVEWPADSE
jgi:hypothetical protein